MRLTRSDVLPAAAGAVVAAVAFGAMMLGVHAAVEDRCDRFAASAHSLPGPQDCSVPARAWVVGAFAGLGAGTVAGLAAAGLGAGSRPAGRAAR